MKKKKRPSDLKLPSVKVAALLGLALISVLVVFHLVMVTFFYPNEPDWLDLYVPSKAGGREYYVTISEFITTNSIVSAITLAFVGLGALFIKLKQPEWFILTGILAIGGVSAYLATMLGNIFHQLWEGAWFIVGIGLAIAFWTLLTYILIKNTENKRNPQPRQQK